MRKTLITVLLALPAAALASGPQTVVLDVQKMTCSLCSVTVKKALEKVPGVSEAKIDYNHKTGTVRFDPENTSAAVLVKATTDAGFPATPNNSQP
jgi:mercuric ion binding protein